MIKYWIYISVMLFTGLQLQGQAYDYETNQADEAYLNQPIERKSFNEKTWEKATRGVDYTVKERKPRERKAPQEKREEKKSENSRTLFIILGVILIAIIIALIIAGVTGHLGPQNKKVKGLSVSIDDIEENIFETDLQRFIRQALTSTDYRMAIRLYFLEILKELALQKKIKWKKEKTNRIYFYELTSTELAEEFGQLSLIFDRVRYGQTDFKQTDFERVEPAFKAFLRKLDAGKL